MVTDDELLARAFRPSMPQIAEILPFSADAPLPGGEHPNLSFEWIGCHNYLGEMGNRFRGANATSADFAFRYRDYAGHVGIVLGEWKYTEYYGRQHQDLGQQKPARLEVYRRSFGRWLERNHGLPPYESFFSEPFYQLMRLTLLAQEMEHASGAEMDAKRVTVVHISPDANDEFASGFTSPVFRPMGRTVTKAWTALCPPSRFVPIASESFLSSVEQAASARQRPWTEWVLKRYGWWRAPSDEASPPQSDPPPVSGAPPKPVALRLVEDMLLAERVRFTWEYLSGPTHHWTYRVSRRAAAPMVALPWQADGVRLRLRSVPKEAIGAGLFREEDDVYAKCRGKHRFAATLRQDWADDASLKSVIRTALLSAFR